jgi:hypothetical protein
MQISYEFVADWPFFRTAFARYRRQQPHRLRNALVMAAAAGVLACAWMYARATNALWISIPEFALIGGISGGIGAFAASKILAPIRTKRLPGFGAKITATFDEDGVTAAEPLAQASMKWAAFTRVVRFPDGILLLRGRVIRWFPDSALQNATPADALAFVRSKTPVTDVG